MKNTAYKKLISEAKSERVKASLTAINETCKEQLKNGITVFSIASVSRAGESRGVPKAQSIRNRAGAIYRELINSWNAEHSSTSALTTGNATKWIERIEDPTLRYLAYELLAKNKNMESELGLYRSTMKLEIDMREKVVDNTDMGTDLNIVDTEMEALKHAVDKEELESQGFKITSRGSVLNKNGKIVFKRGFITAIKKVIESQQ